MLYFNTTPLGLRDFILGAFCVLWCIIDFKRFVDMKRFNSFDDFLWYYSAERKRLLSLPRLYRIGVLCAKESSRVAKAKQNESSDLRFGGN